MFKTCIRSSLGALVALAPLQTRASEFVLGDIEGKYTLNSSYSAVMRLEKPDPRNIDTKGDPTLPISEDLKYPQSNNYDDGNRNFRRGDLVNNRFSLIGDLELAWEDYGVLLRGDAFYDFAYHGKNEHDEPDRINTYQQPINRFTRQAKRFSGERVRLLDAYAWASFDPYGHPLNVRVGQQITAWGQSLFFSGIALAQSSADATRANVPGTDVKSILLPSPQASFRFALTEEFNLLGQYHLEFKPFEIDPVGTYYSVSDVAGPGTGFSYGFRNPFFLDNLSALTLTDPGDIGEIVMTIDSALDGQIPTDALSDLLQSLPLGLPPIALPLTGQNPLNAPSGVNPTYAGRKKPNSKQYSLGLTWDVTDTTQLGTYYLRYTQKTPVVQLNFGELVLIPERELLPGVVLPGITTGTIGLSVPQTYNVTYFDKVDMFALSASALVGGVNIGAELIRREGVDVLIDVDEGVLGVIPQSSRANTTQVLLNGIYTFRPPFYFDTIILVGEAGWIGVDGVEGVRSHEGADAGKRYRNLTASDEAWAVATLAYFDKSNVLHGWDMRIPFSYQQAIEGRSALNGGFGSLFDEGDIRVGLGVELTYLQKLTFGFNYGGFFGRAHFFDHPLADRDTLGLSIRYSVF